ncbi:MAG: hypothetical protein A2172_04245 [Candidatus Woykebacteria bacterium RBG_13_40_15]|uniref:Type II secretion system protein GspF domain-containing protein n=1 Tax=Candidatus Woykebacteria bacterium RBG_13_40_15 TaxID=1802593 RepID=A0A1G1W6Z9_9BACT|nr:MAG: hypothetical protein A2172_04245 [Candidatus Woykebacteria bacterium RBG_13_40_15]
MQEFFYEVKDKQDETLKGVVEAVSTDQAAKILHEQGYTILKIQAKGKGLSLPFLGGIGIGPISQFTRQLATMVTSGLPLADSLDVLKKQTENKNLQVVIEQIAESIQAGNPFSAALQKHPKVFSKAYINVVRAGEASGTLDKVLLRLADNLEKERQFQGEVRGAMIYPAIIVSAMVVVSMIVLVFVVPKLTEVYTGLDIPLPLPTIILMAVSGFMSRFWWLLVILAVAGIYTLRRYKATPEGALVIDRLILRLPVIGKLNRDSSLTEFTRTLSILVGAGVPILESLKIAGDTGTNAVHRDAASHVVALVEKGTPLSKSIEEFPTFPPIISQMTNVGEETGKMDEVLDKVSRFFEQEVEQQVKNLTAAIEPIVMIVLGIGVAFLMISIVLPIYSITSAF